MGIIKRINCKDCNESIPITSNDSYGDVITCPCCGVEYELKNTTKGLDLVELELKGKDDWGE